MTNVYPSGGLLAVVERSGRIESVHHGHLIVVDGAGRTVLAVGSPEVAVFARSSNKPLQAAGLLEAGLSLTTPQLALAAASHSGEPKHVEGVRSTLAGFGLAEDELGCPPSLPMDEAAAGALLAAGGSRSPVYMNCSGKHAAMLAACVVNGWSRPDYLDPAHPVQQLVAATIAELVSEPIEAVGVDGCGAPVAAVTLTGLARAFLHLVHAPSGSPHAVAAAMRARPDLVAGTGRTATVLMEGVPGLLAKEGAEGVFAAALPGSGAVVVKIDDGAARAADVSVIAGLRRLGIDAAALDEVAARPVLGGGRPVGLVQSVLHRAVG